MVYSFTTKIHQPVTGKNKIEYMQCMINKANAVEALANDLQILYARLR